MLVVLGAPLDRARQYALEVKAPFPILADPDRSIYHLYDLERTLGIVQQTASIIIDRAGIIRYHKHTTNPMTWLEEAKQLISVVQHLPHAQ